MRSRTNDLDDDQLTELAVVWRARAARGEQLAFGVAQAFEAEQRRRERIQESQVQPLVAPAQRKKALSRPWWKVW